MAIMRIGLAVPRLDAAMEPLYGAMLSHLMYVMQLDQPKPPTTGE